MPTNLRIMAVEWLDDGRWFAEVWYGGQQIVGVALCGDDRCQPWHVILDPDDPMWASHIARINRKRLH